VKGTLGFGNSFNSLDQVDGDGTRQSSRVLL
jgi:hypothetical protein